MDEKAKGSAVDVESVRCEQRRRVYEGMGHLIRAARRDRHWSEKDLGARVGMEAFRIQALERGSRWGRVHEVYLLAEALEMEPASLVPTWAQLAEENLEELKAKSLTKEHRWEDAWKELFGVLCVERRTDVSPRRSLQALIEAARKLRARADGVIPAGEKPPFIQSRMVLVNPAGYSRWSVEVIEPSAAGEIVVMTRLDDPSHRIGRRAKDLGGWMLAEPFVMKSGEPDQPPGISQMPYDVFSSPPCRDHAEVPRVVAHKSVLPVGSTPPYLAVEMKLRHPDTAAIWTVLEVTQDFAQFSCGKCIMWMEKRTLLNWSLAEWFQTHEMKIQAKSSTLAPPASPHAPDEGVLLAGGPPPYLSPGMVLVEPRGEHHIVRVIEGENVILRETRGGWISSRKASHVAAWPLAEPFEPRAHAGAAQPAKTSLGNLNTPEPAPKANGSRPIWDLVIEDMKARDAAGRAKYGVPLQAHNGRDSIKDAYQEALDLVAYLRQAIEEARAGKASEEKPVDDAATHRRLAKLAAARADSAGKFLPTGAAAAEAVNALAGEWEWTPRAVQVMRLALREFIKRNASAWHREEHLSAEEVEGKPPLSGEQTSVDAPAASSTSQAAPGAEDGTSRAVGQERLRRLATQLGRKPVGELSLVRVQGRYRSVWYLRGCEGEDEILLQIGAPATEEEALLQLEAWVGREMMGA